MSVLAKPDLIKMLMEQQGAKEQNLRVINMMFDNLKPQTAELGLEYEVLLEKMRSKCLEKMDDLLQKLEPAFEIFTEEELRATLELYNSEVGKSILKKSAEVTAIAGKIAQVWAQGVIDSLTQDFKDL